MKRIRWNLTWIAAAFLLMVSCTPKSFALDPQLEANIKAKVEHYLTSYFRLAPQEWVVVSQIWSVDKPSLWGLYVTRNQGGKSQDDVYMLSKDFKTLSLGRVLDFTKDLDAENLGKVSFVDVPTRGPANAPVTLVEYCDLQCPDCKTMADNLKRVLPDYRDKVRVVFKNFPLMNRHPWAEAAAVAARCAYVQKPAAFWSFYDFYYAEQEAISVENLRERSVALAQKAGIDGGQFAACYDSKAAVRTIQEDVYEAAKLGVKGTPTILINGRFVFNEEMTDKDYRKLIDEALANLKR
jgi:protein-disulfide isomerase